MQFDTIPLLLTLKLAILTSICLLLIGPPLAAWLVYGKSRFRTFFEIMTAMPLILPPSVMGFYLILCFSPQYLPGKVIQAISDKSLLFSFPGLVVASIIVTLPFMVFPVKSGFENLPDSLAEAAWTLGKSPVVTFFRVLIPNVLPALMAGVTLAFAHAVGEFGVVLMIGGNLPGETRLASLALYDEVEALNYSAAHLYALSLFAMTFVILLFLYVGKRRFLVSKL